MACLSFALFFTLLFSISARCYETGRGRSAYRDVYQFANETWIENIAVRSSGDLLVTLIFEPELWQIDPQTGTGDLVHKFTDITSVFGIAEASPDVFAVAVGNWSYTDQVQAGTWSIWTLDLNSQPVEVAKVTDLPEAKYLEGMTPCLTSPGTILSADSTRGLIYSVDTTTGAYSTVISNPYLKPNKTAIVPLGVNGIHIYIDSSSQQWLYFSNTFAQPFLGRIPLTSTCEAAGDVQEILAYAPGDVEADDFALDIEGNAYVATNSANSILKVSGDGSVMKVIGGQNDTVVAGADAAAFGRTPWDSNILYVTTTGGIVVPPPSGIVGGKVVAVDLSLLGQ